MSSDKIYALKLNLPTACRLLTPLHRIVIFDLSTNLSQVLVIKCQESVCLLLSPYSTPRVSHYIIMGNQIQFHFDLFSLHQFSKLLAHQAALYEANALTTRPRVGYELSL